MPVKIIRVLLILFVMTFGSMAIFGQQAPESKSKKVTQADLDGFIRIRKDRQQSPVALETSITRFEGKNGTGQPISVDLIGVVHIGEKAYYEQLNELFTGYDVILYELVAPEGTRIPKGGRVDEGLNPIAALQNGMKTMLQLEFQLDHIDYTKENLTHADMTPDEFLESMKSNDESFGKMFLRAIGQSIAMQNSSNINNVDVLLSLMSNDPVVKIRRLMADQMRDMESGMVIFEGRNGSTIITHRNAKVLRILQKQIDAGKQKIGIFFGAGHMPDMQQHLIDDFKFRRGGRIWYEAWNLRIQ